MKRREAEPAPEPFMDGFEHFYANQVEHHIRLPSKTQRADARAIWLTYAAIGATLITLLCWLLGLSPAVVGLLCVLSGALIVGALQLRMAGSSPGLHEIRNLVCAKMAAFNAMDYDAAPETSKLDALIQGAGGISHTAITRGADHIEHTVGQAHVASTQLLGGPGPSAAPEAGGRWLGIEVERIWPQYSCDGLFIRVDLPEPIAIELTLSCDDRLLAPPEGVPLLEFAPVATGDAPFDETFRAYPNWLPQANTVLNAELRALLSEIRQNVGPVTFYVAHHSVFLSAWHVGDLYEVTSLGFGLKRQAHQVARTLRLGQRLAEALPG
ncbi:MAG: hypothetical protein AAF458_20105 [Pseudomonadota bacterium]